MMKYSKCTFEYYSSFKRCIEQGSQLGIVGMSKADSGSCSDWSSGIIDLELFLALSEE